MADDAFPIAKTPAELAGQLEHFLPSQAWNAEGSWIANQTLTIPESSAGPPP